MSLRARCCASNWTREPNLYLSLSKTLLVTTKRPNHTSPWVRWYFGGTSLKQCALTESGLLRAPTTKTTSNFYFLGCPKKLSSTKCIFCVLMSIQLFTFPLTGSSAPAFFLPILHHQPGFFAMGNGRILHLTAHNRAHHHILRTCEKQGERKRKVRANNTNLSAECTTADRGGGRIYHCGLSFPDMHLFASGRAPPSDFRWTTVNSAHDLHQVAGSSACDLR